MRTLVCIVAATAMMTINAKAAQFNGSYTLDGGQIIEFLAEGTVQGDLDTVIIDSFLTTPTFDGIAPLVTNPQFFGNTISFSGDTLDLDWFGDSGVGFQLTTNFGFFSSGPGYGNIQESLNDSFTLSIVPEPTSVLLGALATVGLLMRRRGLS